MVKNNKEILRNSKGQAALEFLTTYGWAILVILVTIAALSSFGVLNPERFLPNTCDVGSEFSCNEQEIFNDGEVNFIMRNNVGNDLSRLNVTEAQVASGIYEDPGTDVNCTTYDIDNDVVNQSNTVRSGAIVQVNCTVPTEFIGSIGGKLGVDFEFVYETLGAQIANPLSARIYSTIQDGS